MHLWAKSLTNSGVNVGVSTELYFKEVYTLATTEFCCSYYLLHAVFHKALFCDKNPLNSKCSMESYLFRGNSQQAKDRTYY